ncbi:hypothetical protein [Halosimplex amylolyticum]|uniref:hypothetical protein n=1 Tax=Halosimplex amylolyticum TaxID=3396616 RepID=UPI003F5669BC
MARFTIDMPADLVGEASGHSDRPDGADRRHDGAETHERSDLDAATHGFVSWVECWARA